MNLRAEASLHGAPPCPTEKPNAQGATRVVVVNAPRQWTLRSVPWLGGCFIGAIVALAAYDIVRSYHTTVLGTGRELDTQARVIAEQTARGLQAVDVVLRHLVEQHQRGTLSALSREDMRAYLREQAVGLVQIDGLAIANADGSLRASSYIDPAQEPTVNISGNDAIEALRPGRYPGPFVGNTRKSAVDGQWFFPMARRLESTSGEFLGLVVARGRIDYFQQFYRDIRLDQGTKTTLMHQKGTLLARHPPAESALGKHFALFDELLALRAAQQPGPSRTVSPVDGVERFGALELVPDYPLAVIVTRETNVALEPWREHAVGTGLRTLALSALAVLLLAIVSRQLTRLYEARASLEVSRERYALAVAGSDGGIWDFDFAANQAFASTRAREILGVPRGPETQPLDDWFASLELHPEDAPRRLAALKAHLDGEAPAYVGEFRTRHPDGSFRWVRIHGLCMRDANGKPQRMAGSVSDIDARKRAEESLRQSEERFALAVAGSNEGLWDWDLASDMMFVSPRAQEFMGLEPSEPRRPRREWIRRTACHPDDMPLVRTALSAHLRGLARHFVVEYRMRHHSGTWRWYRQRGLALRNDQGRPYRMAGSMEDITESKNAEAERGRLETKLRQAQKLEAMGTLAGGIAHDFNNILSAILGYGEMAQKDATEGSALRRHIDAAINAGMRAKALVERILAFSRSGMGERVPVHVEAVVHEALDLVAASLPAGVRLERQLVAGNAAVMGDPTQVHQVVMNLCTNAVQAMTSGGILKVVLECVEMSTTTVATSTLSAGSYVRLRVQDSGTGIPASIVERIFDPFFTAKDVSVGTGLGLSLVHGIVTDLGGGIDVDSRIGEGATFSVYLPWHGHATMQKQVEDVVANGAGETILLVDDEVTLVRLVEEMIADLGYEPVGFTSSRAALEAFRTSPERFDAVLSDETMPDMTGSDLAREIRAVRPDMPFVLMSGYVSSAVSARARAAGIFEVLSKPLASRDIGRCLDGLLHY